MGLLIGFSRLYLGVHTPLDVVVSLVLAAVLSQVLYQTVEEAKRRPGYMFRLWVFMLIPAALFVLFALRARAGIAADHPYLANYTSAIKTSVSILACTLGAIVTIVVDENVTRFETEAVWWVQVIKVVLGLGLVVAVKAGLKAPLYDLLGQGSFFADGIRYFFMVIVAGVLWPLTFHFFSHLGRK
jgi:undecaprenyl-diphosphatase